MNIFERTVARPLGRAMGRAHRSSLSLATRQLFGIELPNGASASVNELADVRVPYLLSTLGAALGDRGARCPSCRLWHCPGAATIGNSTLQCRRIEADNVVPTELDSKGLRSRLVGEIANTSVTGVRAR